MIVDQSFIPNIVNFDSKQITEKIRTEIEKTYLSDPKFNFDTVNRASKACGPLVKWVTAQMAYSEILDKVKPLREEVEQLESAAQELNNKQKELQENIQELEKTIATYKEEYALLISEAQQVKL